jgi:hypothetical protein
VLVRFGKGFIETYRSRERKGAMTLLHFTHGAGLDAHKKSVTACRITPDPTGQQADGIMELKECGTMTVDLLALCDWLAEAGITQVAMESPGE